MTREEAIEELERLLRHWDLIDEGIYDLSEHDKDAVDIALSALRPVSREQVEKMRGKWIDARYSSKDVPKCQCSICGKKYIGLETDFCQYCGAPMTDKAVDILWKRLEAMQDEAETV